VSLSLNLPFTICCPLARLARRFAPPRPETCHDQAAYFEHQYLSTQRMHERFMRGFSFAGSVVIDVGSGLGGRAPYWLQHGAGRVICVDINRQELEAGAAILGEKFPEIRSRVDFLHPDEILDRNIADVALLFDSFEHLTDPSTVLQQCFDWLRPGGKLWIGSIGWYHYMASHCLEHIPIPWCQVFFSQRAIIRTIRAILRQPGYVPNVWERLEGLDRWDQIERLSDRPGEPLNLLSLRQVRNVLRASPFELSAFQVHGFSGRVNPVARALAGLAHLPLLRELFHSYYTAVLVKSQILLNQAPSRQFADGEVASVTKGGPGK
jgi:SAM-dependent methyltransferase